MKKIHTSKLLNSLVLPLGIAWLLSPLLFYWLIHGNYERYLWIIRSPYPFNNFGSAPFQLLFLTIIPIIIGATLIIMSIFIRKKLRK